MVSYDEDSLVTSYTLAMLIGEFQSIIVVSPPSYRYPDIIIVNSLHGRRL